ncbi:hypothetical protein [Actinotalea sp. C106]|uniref:hypothetical protein n=1 Tax=Actinotalea sp. C106 TaxID=2908644 RepID=UPI0020294596|nr:hypothetical protein [Actinotalea sp. C106]
MTTDSNDQPSPFARPGFIAAAVVVTLIIVAGIILAITNATSADTDPGPAPQTDAATTTPVPTPTEEPAGTTTEASICDLGGAETGTARLTTAPDVDAWEYQGTTAYPTSQTFGPGATNDTAGYRYCFQRTPEGALLAATYALAVGSDQAVVPQWIEYFTAPGPYRDQFLEQPPADRDSSSVRMRVAGFRLLSYEGDAASVDLAFVASTQGQTINASLVYDLVWSDGDWKIDTSSPEPGSFSTIPDLAGYVPWSE